MQTNKPFTYKIPENLQGQLERGMRVVVPFGKGNRLIQGFIINFKSSSENIDNIKEIDSVLDLEPVLNEEMLEIADWLSKYTFSFKIRCLQVMLPSIMKAKYERKFTYIGEQDEKVKELFSGKSDLLGSDKKVNSSTINKLLQLRKQGKIKVDYIVKNKAKAKLVSVIKTKLSLQEYENELGSIAPNASKQKKLLNTLKEFPVGSKIRQSELREKYNFTNADIKNASEKGWIDVIKVEKYRDPFANYKSYYEKKHKLTQEQSKVVKKLDDDIENDKARVSLLQGVTGSGKTEVYLQVIDTALNQGKTAIVLVPEISLTPQMVKRFRARFGTKVAALHSGLSIGEKYDEWRRIEREEAQVVVGARSAIFAPLKNLGVIIVDEEHESSYKQDEMPRYNAKDVAKWRGIYHSCPVIFGSATPSLESRARAQKGVYDWLRLTKRVNNQKLPKVQIIDMREAVKTSPIPDFSLKMVNSIQEKLDKKEQIVLLLNRRGYSTFMMCRECGYVIKCPNCDISLTVHLDSRSLKCHYCGYETRIPYECPSCSSKKIRYYGTGTQKIEKELKGLFPQARILRMDVDTTRKKGAHEKLLRTFGDGKADILLGTQMIAKGLDFPNVTFVGVLNADTSLGISDFRASERTFQLLTQVSGRAGRADKDGEVIIQTFNPDHYAIKLAQNHDYENFFYKEMELRHNLNYPPYYYTLKITVSSNSESLTARTIFKINNEVRMNVSKGTIILGPTPQTVTKINNRYYYQIVIKYKKETKLINYLQDLLLSSQRLEREGIQIVIDREPLKFN